MTPMDMRSSSSSGSSSNKRRPQPSLSWKSSNSRESPMSSSSSSSSSSFTEPHASFRQDDERDTTGYNDDDDTMDGTNSDGTIHGSDKKEDDGNFMLYDDLNYLMREGEDDDDTIGNNSNSIDRDDLDTTLSSSLSSTDAVDPSTGRLRKAIRKGFEGVSTRIRSRFRGMLGFSSKEEKEDVSWFEPKRQEIIAKYDKLREEMKAELEQKVRDNPAIASSDAEHRLEKTLFAEMQAEIRSARNEMRLQRFREFEQAEIQRLESQDKVQERQRRFEEFQKETIKKMKNKQVDAPKEGEDLNDWAMRGLEDALLTTEDMMDERRANQQMDKINAIRDKMEEIKARPKAPESYAEYKMQLELQRSIEPEEVDTKLEEWKNFVDFQRNAIDELERKTSSVSAPPPAATSTADEETSLSSGKAMNLVGGLNRDALHALEKLRDDGFSSAELDEAINELRALEDKNFVDSNFEQKLTKKDQQQEQQRRRPRSNRPISVEEAFPGFTASGQRRLSDPPGAVQPPTPIRRDPDFIRQNTVVGPPLSPTGQQGQDEDDPMWFLDDEEEDDDVAAAANDNDSMNTGMGALLSDEKPKPPPDTAFFAPSDTPAVGRDAPVNGDSLLGSYDDQRLQNQFRLQGVVSKEEQDKIKQGYDDFQRFQEEMARKYAMDVDDESFSSTVSPGYEAKTGLTDDGQDVDAESFLAYLDQKYSDSSASSTPAAPMAPPPPTTTTTTLPEQPVADSTQPPNDAATPVYEPNGDTGVDMSQLLTDDGGDVDVEKFMAMIDSNVNRRTGGDAGSTETTTSGSTTETVDQSTVDTNSNDDDDKPVVIVRRRRLGGFERIQVPESQGSPQEEEEENGEPDIPVDTGFLGTEYALDTEPQESTAQPPSSTTDEDKAAEERYEDRIIARYGLDAVDVKDVLGRRSYGGGDDYDYYGTTVSYPERRADADLTTYFVEKSDLLLRNALDVSTIDAIMDRKDSLELEAMPANMGSKKVETPFREFGAVFRLEGGLIDMTQIEKVAWEAVAEAYAQRLPTMEDIKQAAVANPADVPQQIFGWTTDATEAAAMTDAHHEALRTLLGCQSSGLADKGSLGFDMDFGASASVVPALNLTALSPAQIHSMVPPVPDGDRWVSTMLSLETNCGLVSYHDDDLVSILLENAGLTASFPVDKRVTSTSNYVNEPSRLLGIALRIDRRPKMCVVFDSSPKAIRVAHDVDMKAIGMVGAYPAYELVAADTTAMEFDRLTAMNIRRLFSDDESRDPKPEESNVTPIITRRTAWTTYGNPEDDDDDGTDSDDGGSGTGQWNYQDERGPSYEERLDRALRDGTRKWYNPDRPPPNKN